MYPNINHLYLAFTTKIFNYYQFEMGLYFETDSGPLPSVHGPDILFTKHDAYCWLSGRKGIGTCMVWYTRV